MVNTTRAKAATGRVHAWKLAVYGVAGVLTVLVPLLIPDTDLSGLLYFLIAVPGVSIYLAVQSVQKRGRRRSAVLSVLLLYWLFSGAIFRHFSEARDVSRWICLSTGYKARVLAHPTPPSGDFRHVEWEGWGFAGEYTTVYLVVDPNNSLATAAKDHLVGKFNGVSCPVYRVRRLESHWYSVAFYTDTAWGQCE